MGGCSSKTSAVVADRGAMIDSGSSSLGMDGGEGAAVDSFDHDDRKHDRQLRHQKQRTKEHSQSGMRGTAESGVHVTMETGNGDKLAMGNKPEASRSTQLDEGSNASHDEREQDYGNGNRNGQGNTDIAGNNDMRQIPQLDPSAAMLAKSPDALSAQEERASDDDDVADGSRNLTVSTQGNRADVPASDSSPVQDVSLQQPQQSQLSQQSAASKVGQQNTTSSALFTAGGGMGMGVARIPMPIGGRISKKLGGIEEGCDEDNADETETEHDAADHNEHFGDDLNGGRQRQHQNQNDARTPPSGARDEANAQSLSLTNHDDIPPSGPILFDDIPADSTLHQLASKFVEMINFDPWDKQPFSSNRGALHSVNAHSQGDSHSHSRQHSKPAYYSETAVYQFISKYPDLCRIRYHLEEHFAMHMFPLSILCCLSTHSRTARTIEACHWAHPDAMNECDVWVGTPLHYACSYQASPSVVQFLSQENPAMVSTANAFGRLPLHMLTLFPMNPNDDPQAQASSAGSPASSIVAATAAATPLLATLPSAASTAAGYNSSGMVLLTAQCVDLLLRQYPESAAVADMDGYLPLHLACENGADIAVLRHLLSLNPDSIYAKSNQGSTPLHFACLQQAPLSVINFLLASADGAVPGHDNEHGQAAEGPDAVAKIEAAPSQASVSLCRAMDSMGQLPLHMAILGSASMDVLSRLLQLYPASKAALTDRGETAWQMAHRLRAPSDVLDLMDLKPKRTAETSTNGENPTQTGGTNLEGRTPERFSAMATREISA